MVKAYEPRAWITACASVGTTSTVDSIVGRLVSVNLVIEYLRLASRFACPFLQADSRRSSEIPDQQLHAAVIAANGSHNITWEFEVQGFRISLLKYWSCYRRECKHARRSLLFRQNVQSVSAFAPAETL